MVFSQSSFVYNPLLHTWKFSCTYLPLSFCKNLKKFLEPIQIYEDVPFSGPKWHTCPEQFFFGTNHYYLFHLPIGLFYCAKFLKILTADQELWGCAIFGPKMVHLPQTKIFQKIINIVLIYLLALFRKPVNEPCFFHLCLSTCQNSNLAEWNIDD